MRKIYDTLIVGAGASGLGCARTLFAAKKNFLILTQDVGGRILSSPNGLVNYGAYLVADNYHNMLPFVEKRRRLHPFFVDFHTTLQKTYHLSSAFLFPLEIIRFSRILYRFYHAFERFKKRVVIVGQKKALEEDVFLYRLYQENAAQFVVREGFPSIAQKYLSKGVYMCTFLSLSKISAFDLFHLCLGIVVPTYEFIFLKSKILSGFEKKIVSAKVIKVHKGKPHKIVTSSGDIYYAHSLVIATPPHISKKLLGIAKIKKPVTSYVFHVYGKLRKRWGDGQFVLFGPNSSTIFIRMQEDGTFIFYSKVSSPRLQKYFIQPKIIYKKKWNPAFNMGGTTLLESMQGNNLFMVGDYNIDGVECSYITGVYAANQIIKNKKKEKVWLS